MLPKEKAWVLLVAAYCIFAVGAGLRAESDGWSFERDGRGNPSVEYRENGRSVMSLECGRALGFWAVYPDQGRNSGAANFMVSNSGRKLVYPGDLTDQFVEDDDVTTSNTIYIVSWNLGLNQGESFDKELAELLGLLSASGDITVTGEKGSYKIPHLSNDVKKKFDGTC